MITIFYTGVTVTSFVKGDQQTNIDNVEVTAFCLGVTSHFFQTMQKQSTVTSK